MNWSVSRTCRSEQFLGLAGGELYNLVSDNNSSGSPKKTDVSAMVYTKFHGVHGVMVGFKLHGELQLKAVLIQYVVVE